MNKNADVDKAPDLATINQVTGYVENGADKPFYLKRNFVRLTMGVRMIMFIPKKYMNISHISPILGSFIHQKFSTANGD